MIGTTVGQYRITEKLGAGGMGEVYLAEDSKLKRKVALKFLPERLSSDPEFKSRFEHEAQAAASLNHPNIITVHDLGEHEGRLYIAMEHVGGQTLADIIAKDTLSLKKALEIAVQICSGLSAAHGAGIVHRDIKPANIMLTTDGQAKILDFGLAKSRKASTETRVGSTMGTIQYESPEQSRGEEVDARSDIFSFGVVLYEMITGRRPFAGEFDEAIRYAISHESHEPLSRYKSEVPLQLEELISNLLEKDPELRAQSAQGVVADLKRITRDQTPGYTTAPRPPITQPASPAPTAATSQATAVTTVTDKKRNPYLIPGSVVFVLILTALIFKPWSIDISSTKEAAADNNSLAVMYFENVVDPSDEKKIGRMLTSLLITDLSGAGKLKVVSRQRLFDILRLLGKEDETVLDQAVASQVAEKAKVRWILTGEILQDEPLVVTAVISDPQSGEILTSERVSASAGENIFSVVDKLSAGILANYSASEASGADGSTPVYRDVSSMTTSSPEAYRLFLEGVELNMKFYNVEAREKLREAVKLDSTFAIAHLWLVDIAASREESRWAMKQAVRFIDNASEKDQLWIRVEEAQMENRSDDIQRYGEELIRRYPDDKMSYVIYATSINDNEKKVELYLQAIELDPLFEEVYNLLAYAYDNVGNFERSLWAINKYVELAPDDANPYDSRGDLYAFHGDLENAKKSYQKALDIKSDFFMSRFKLGAMHVYGGEYEQAELTLRGAPEVADMNQQSFQNASLMTPYQYQGQMKLSLKKLDDLLAWARENGVDASIVREIHLYRRHLLATLGNHKAVVELYSEVSTSILEIESVSFSDTVDFIFDYTQALARAGEILNAEEYADSLDMLLDTTSDTTMNHLLYSVRGTIAFARQDFAEAVKQRELVIASSRKSFPKRYLLGRAYLANGQLAEAVDIFTKALIHYDELRMWTPGWNVKAYYYLAIAYEESGWNDKAIEQYETFLDIWKNADPEIKELDDARKRLARLTA